MSLAALLGTFFEIPTTNSPHNWRLRLVFVQGQLGKDGRDPAQTYPEAARQVRGEYRASFGEPPADLLPEAAS